MESQVFDKLPLENALEDSPQIRTLVSVFSADSQALKEYVTTLHQLSSKLVAAHNQLTSAYQDLSKHLKSYKNVRAFPKRVEEVMIIGDDDDDDLDLRFNVDNDREGVVASTLDKFAAHISEMSSWEHIVATQIADGAVYPLSRFIDTELHDLDTMANLYHNAGSDLERALTRYSRCRRKDPEHERREANEDVYISKKKFHQMSLHYYSKLNLIQYSRHSALLEPVIGVVAATRTHHSLANDTLAAQQITDFLSNITVSAKTVHDDLVKEREENLELIDSFITQSQLMYYAQPPPDIAALPPDTTIATKSGYLNVQKKYMGVMSSWERQFVFLEGGNLLSVVRGEAAGSLLLELDSSTLVHATDTDDRLHVFQVATSKKSVTLQALNDRERDEWMLTVNNIALDGGYIKDQRGMTQPSLLSGVGQFFADKFHAASAAMGSTPSTPTLSGPPSTTGAPTNTITTLEAAINPDAPIVFDLLASTEESGRDGDDDAGETSNENKAPENGEGGSFSVRFLGSMGVNMDRGQYVVCEVMRRILAARAIHNVFSTMELSLSTTSTHLLLSDPTTRSVRLKHNLRDVSYWAAHTENHKLVGYIVRQSESGSDNVLYSCFVYEADVSGAEICATLGAAAKNAFDQLVVKKTQEKKRMQETKLLLQNIAQLPDIDAPPQVSADGQFLVLDGEIPGSSPHNTPPTIHRPTSVIRETPPLAAPTQPGGGGTAGEAVVDPESEA